MKKMKKLVILLVILLLFGLLHHYTEKKFSNPSLKGMTEQIEGWADWFGLDWH